MIRNDIIQPMPSQYNCQVCWWFGKAGSFLFPLPGIPTCVKTGPTVVEFHFLVPFPMFFSEDRIVSIKTRRFRSQTDLNYHSALATSSCIGFGILLNLSGPQFCNLKNGIS